MEDQYFGDDSDVEGQEIDYPDEIEMYYWRQSAPMKFDDQDEDFEISSRGTMESFVYQDVGAQEGRIPPKMKCTKSPQIMTKRIHTVKQKMDEGSECVICYNVILPQNSNMFCAKGCGVVIDQKCFRELTERKFEKCVICRATSPWRRTKIHGASAVGPFYQ